MCRRVGRPRQPRLGNWTATKFLGIVGGTGPESTVDYYRSIIDEWRRRHRDGTLPHVMIDSIDGGSLWDLIEADDRPAIAVKIAEAVQRLAAAGAGAAILASNTVHVAFDQIASKAPIPLISIVDETVRAASARGLRRVALLGTRFVVDSDLYRAPLAKVGIEMVVPAPNEQSYVDEIYVSELQLGTMRHETRRRLVELVAAMRQRTAVDGLVLGGTELSLILPDPFYAGLPVLATAKVHVDAAVAWLSGEDSSAD